MAVGVSNTFGTQDGSEAIVNGTEAGIGFPPTTSVETWNGSTFTSDPAPPLYNANDPYDLTQISCPSVGFCELAGSYLTAFSGCNPELPFECGVEIQPSSTAVNWDGTAWSDEPITAETGDTSVTALSCSSPAYCITISGSDANVDGSPVANLVNLNGSPLATQPPFDVSTTTGVSCLADADCVVVGSNASEAEIVSFDGTSWNTETAAPLGEPHSQLTGVSCLGDGFCVGVGSDNSHSTADTDSIDTPLIETNGTMPAPDDAAVTLSVSPTPPVTGPVTYTVDLAGSPAPTGSVTIATQGQTCTGTVASGQGSCTIVEHASGGQTEYIDVEYSGDETVHP